MSGFALRGVSFVYGDKPVLSGAEAEFEEGRAHVVTGESGAGKTTLLRLLAGLEEPTGGEVEGAGARRVAVVFQEDRLCENLTATANIRLPRGALRGEALECELVRDLGALSAVGIGAAEAARPVRELSGGQRRRVAILRALLADGDAFLFDEALRGLDARTADVVMDFARPYLARKTVLWITHDGGEARYFERPVRWEVREGGVIRLG